MGVDIALTRFFDQCAKSAGGLAGPMLALGSLTLRETPEVLAEYASANGYTRLAREQSVGALFSDRYGVDRYLSCDINGQADLFLDLGLPLPDDQKGVYLSVVNGGTLEHLFDLRLAMQNIHDASAVGGLMIHTCPVTWFDHGFVNINPVLFHLTAEVNDYEVVAEGYHFYADTWEGQGKPAVSIIGVDEFVPGGATRLQDVFTRRELPAYAMHLIALRKRRNGQFVQPVQVSL
jgi:hypothetical protein